MFTSLSVEALALLISAVALVGMAVATVLVLGRPFASVAATASLGPGAGQPEGAHSETAAAPSSAGPNPWREVFDAIPDPVEVRDARGRLVLANASHARIAEGLGADLPRDVRIVEEGIEERGETRWISWAESSVDLAGRRHRVRSGREITAARAEHRTREDARLRAEAANEAKSRVLANVSHEFRTPLNGILGMTGLLLDSGLDQEQTTYVQAVRSSAEAFLGLVEEILDFSRIEAGKIELSDEAFDLPALVQGAVELLAPRAQGKGIEIACFVAEGVPRLVRGDPDRLRQVLFNLAGNAVKFTSVGGVGITVEPTGGHAIRLCVEDTGPGIPAEQAATIFEAYRQGEDASARQEGTGLGLAITRRLVERMDGRIDVRSVVGQGSSFSVALSLPRAGPEIAPPPARAAARSVLILSASPFGGAYLARTLRQAGHAAITAATFGEALARMDDTCFDVVLADHGMADADVRSVAREARSRGIERSVVLLSPFERRDFGSPHAAGFDAYLVKPVRPRSLFEQIAPSAGYDDTCLTPMPGSAADAREPGSGLHVLLAEDNEINALLAMKSLQRLASTVEWVRNGRDALARAEAAVRGEGRSIDLVLMDVRMPELDGIEATRRLRAFETARGARRMRVVAVTASVVGSGRRLLGPDAFDAVMMKPFSLQELAAVMRKAERVRGAGAT